MPLPCSNNSGDTYLPSWPVCARNDSWSLGDEQIEIQQPGAVILTLSLSITRFFFLKRNDTSTPVVLVLVEGRNT